MQIRGSWTPIALLLSGLGLFAHEAQAQTCVDDLTSRSNVCTANDVSFNSLTVQNIVEGCVSASDTATVELRGTLIANTDRYDIGFFIAQDGGDAFTGDCFHGYFPPPLVAPPGHDPTSGFGPYAELEGNNADSCGDIVSGESTLRDMQNVIVQCSDINTDGFLDIGTCVSWDNQAKQNCGSVAEALPGTKSKCNCERLDTATGVPNLTLTKSCLPDTARPGETISCTITYENTGLGPADWITFVDDYPQAAGTVANLNPPAGDTVVDNGDTLVWTPGGSPATLANIPPGATGTLSYDFILSTSLMDGDSFSNTVTAHWDGIAQPSLTATETTNVVTTAALVDSFRVFDRNGERRIEWVTASESRTAGFFVERYDRSSRSYHAVNELAVPASLQPQGGSYVVIDGTAPHSAIADYRLIEIEFDGRRLTHGPFRVRVEPATDSLATRIPAGRNFLSAAHDGHRNGRGFGAEASSNGRAPRRGLARGRRAQAAPTDRLKLFVYEDGVHRIGIDTLAEAFGEDRSRIAREMQRGMFALEHRGEPVAWSITSDGEALLFYAAPFRNPYSLADVYWLRLARGVQVDAGKRGRAKRATVHGGSFLEHRRVEEDRFAGVSIPFASESDFWFWDMLFGYPGSTSVLDFDLIAPSTEPFAARLTLRMQGFQESAEHTVLVSLNGEPLGDVRFHGTAPHVAELDLDGSLLLEGANRLTLEPDTSGGASFIGLFVDGFDLEYRRRFEAHEGSLRFRAEGASTVSLVGFPSERTAVWNVSRPKHPVVVPTSIDSVADDFRLSFVPIANETYVAFSEDLATDVAEWEVVEPSRLGESMPGVDYVIITPVDFEPVARAFAEYREPQGHRVAVATVDAIANEFNHGIVSPAAIRDYLSHVYKSSGASLKNVLLAGAGNFDYRDLMGSGQNFVPPLLVSTRDGLLSSDPMYADVLGNDGVIEFAVGRVPATSVEQLQAYFDKVQSMEATGVDGWRQRVLLVADNPDRAGDFIASTERIRSTLPAELNQYHILLGETHDAVGARSTLFDSWNAGALAIGYVGHGSLLGLAQESLLDATQAEALSNGERLPLFAGLTCHIGRFDIPFFEPLSSKLVLNASGGAAAVWSPVGPSVNSAATNLGRLFLADALSPNTSLGEAMLETFKQRQAVPEQLDLLKTYHLLGDPAIRLR